MKVCPECKQTYDDDVEVCQDDGATLIQSDEVLPESPELPDVLEVGTSDATAIVDLEAMEDEIRTQRERNEAEKSRLQEEAEIEAQRQAVLNDPETTGVISLDEVKAKHEREAAKDPTAQHQIDDDVPAPSTQRNGIPFSDEQSRSMASVDDNDPTAQVRKRDKPLKKDQSENSGCKKAALVFLALLFGMALVGVLALVGFRVLGPFGGRPVLLTSKPNGALIMVDGKELGKSPLNTHIAPGNHRLELRKKGYEPFKEVFALPKAEGKAATQKLDLNFELVPLPGTVVSEDSDGGATNANEPEESPESGDEPEPSETDPGTDEERATLLVKQAEAAIALRDYDKAFANIQALLKLAPEDPRSDDLIDALATAREDSEDEMLQKAARKKADEKRKRGNGKVKGPFNGKRRGDDESIATRLPRSKKERTALSRKAYSEGERLYRLGQFKDAKLMLSRAIQLAPRFAQPHRSLGRIYNREGNSRKVRYHLSRYIRLGGPDPDRKVRRWLEEHKK